MLKVKSLIYSKGMNQKELASVIGMDAPNLSCRMSGQVRWPVEDFAKAAKVLGVSMDELWELTKEDIEACKRSKGIKADTQKTKGLLTHGR